ncbi:uncharacterized protein N7518_002247, partial [Penicillium psychrosexuale]|uniref:uncharacterized protein n=1 Tax=Penicillium psychrosexuale TaxID=1002107 RepID=UPI0025458F86
GNVFSPLDRSYAASIIDRAPRIQSDTYDKAFDDAKLRVDAEARQTLQNQSEKIEVVFILQSRPQYYVDITASNSQQDTLSHGRIAGLKAKSSSHRPVPFSLFFHNPLSSVDCPRILLLFHVLVELGTWYARRCNLIYHHY